MAEKKVNARAEQTYTVLLIAFAIAAFILPFLVINMNFNWWDWGVIILFFPAFFLRKHRATVVTMRIINTILLTASVVLFAGITIEYCMDPEHRNMLLQWVFGRLILPTVALSATYGNTYDAWLMHVAGFLFTAETALFLLFNVKTGSWLVFVVLGGVALVLWALSIFVNPIPFPKFKKKAAKKAK